MKSTAKAAVLLSLAASSLATYDLVKTYSGNSFFDSWSYYGHYDNLTFGVQSSCSTILAEPRASRNPLS
jgi:hypothetical protein